MRSVIQRFDRFMRRRNGIFEFTDAEWCIFRLQLRDAPQDVWLSDGTFIGKGEPILGLHFWNEHMPPLGSEGADMAWGLQMARVTVRSFRAVAAWVEDHPDVAGRRALGGAMVVLALGEVDGPANLLRRLGFEIFPYHSPLGRFGEFWENLYTWALMWTYNPPSLHQKSLTSVQRTMVWMPLNTLLARYGSSQLAAANSGH